MWIFSPKAKATAAASWGTSSINGSNFFFKSLILGWDMFAEVGTELDDPVL